MSQDSDSGLDYDPQAACAALTTADPVLGRLIQRIGVFSLHAHMQTTPFEALLRAIVYQQLSGKAAGTIHGRVLALFGDGGLTPAALAAMSEQRLAGAGLSRNKIAAVKDLAAHTRQDKVPSLATLRAMPDDAIIERLTAVRGIGRWTVEMLLIFRLGRPDVLPVNDLGVRKGFALAFDLEELPRPKALAEYGQRWAPYRSVAAWYLWRAADTRTP